MEIGRLGRQGLVVPTPGLERLLRERAARGHVRGEVHFRRADGTTFPAEMSSTLAHLPAGGREVVDAIRARRPEVAARLVSGHPRPAAGRDDPAEPGLEVLARSFTSSELLERIRPALDRRG